MKRSVYLSSLLALCCTLFAITARAQAPVVTTNPVHDTTCHADTAWFRSAATGTGVTFHWEFSNDGGTSWDTTTDGTTYFGTFNDTLRVIATMSMQGTQYRMVATNASGTDTSNVAMLTVDTLVGAITASATEFCKASTVTLSNPIAGGVWTSSNPSLATVGSSSGIVTGVNGGWDTVRYTLINTCGMSRDSIRLRIDTNMISYPITGPNAVCVGNTITLGNHNTEGTKVWTVGMTGNTSISSMGVVTGLVGGLDTVTYTITNTCNSVTSDLEILVDTVIAAGTITASGPTTFCAGTWLHLDASTEPAGIWLSGSTSVAVVSTAGNVTGIGQGTSVISYYHSNSCGASFATLTVTVQIPAAPIGGNDSVGIDSTIMLTNIVPGGTWTTADASIASVIGATGAVTGEDTGVTTIFYTVTNTCGTSSSSIVMNVGPLPDAGTLSGPDSVCVGSNITITPSIVGGTWNSRHDTLATITSGGVVTGVEFGRDTIDYYITTAFGRSRVSKSVFVNEVPQVYVSGPGSISLGGSYVELGFPSGGIWTSNNPGMAPITAQSFTVDSGKTKSTGFFVVIDTGTTIFTYTKSNTCGTTIKKDTVHLPGATEVMTVGKGAAHINIFPNPSQGALSVNLTSAINEEVVFTLTNVTGQAVQEFKVQANTPTNIFVDQPAGVYMLNAVTKDGNKHSARISITR